MTDQLEQSDIEPGAGTSDTATENQGALTGDQGNQGGAEGNGAQGNADANADGNAQAPENYDFTMPDGMALDEGLAAAATPVMKEIGLTQDQAQKLAAVVAAERSRESADAVKAADEAFNEQVTSWEAEIKADKEFGGDNYDATTAAAARAINKFGSPELIGMFEQTGVGSHPELIKAFAKMGRLISEDQPGSGDAASGGSTPEQRMYPNDAAAA